MLESKPGGLVELERGEDGLVTGVVAERCATRPSAVERVIRCNRSTSSRTSRQVPSVAFSVTHMRSSASQHS